MIDGLHDAGAVVTGGLVARELDGKGGDGAPSSDAPVPCPNCGHVARDHYCAHCGQPTHLHRNVVGFAHDVVHGVFHFDGKFFKTLPLLALKPGHLTRRYIDGERQKFVTPMAMFLFSVFLMFAVVSNLHGWTADDGGPSDINIGGVDASEGSGIQLDGTRRKITQALEDTDRQIARLEATRATQLVAKAPTTATDAKLKSARDDRTAMATAAAWLPTSASDSPRVSAKVLGQPLPKGNALEAWLKHKIQLANDNPQLMVYKMKSAGYKYSWALIPLSLPFLWLMFAWRRRFGLYDHAVFATYSISFMSLLMVAMTVVAFALGDVGRAIAWPVILLVPPLHMYKQLRYGYQLTRFSAAWRTGALLIVVSTTATLFFLLLLYLGVAD